MLNKILICLFILSSAAFAEDEKVWDRKMTALTSAVIMSTVFDVETTFSAIKKPGVVEGNPLMRPIINAGRPATYAALGAIDLGVIYYSYTQKKGGRRMWWLPPLVTAASHAIAGSFNLRFVF